MGKRLWTCPKCGRQFAHAHQWHACTKLSLEAHLATKTSHAIDLYQRVQSLLERCGEFRIHPQKTRIAFINTMSFAGVSMARRWVDVSFILPAPLADERIRRIDLYGPTSFGHRTRLHGPAEVDEQLAGWLCEAYRRGLQETLDSAAQVEPVVGHALEVMTVPLRARVVDHGGSLAYAVPEWVVDALAANPAVIARIGGNDYGGEIRGSRLELDEIDRLGVRAGDRSDVLLRAAV